MESTNKKNKNKPPNLIKGILVASIGITLAILAISWLTIDYHLEQLVKNRTSEYAHSIARIAADSSAEALLSDDKLQLNLLVQNVAKDPYIRQATVISEDGRVVTQAPEEQDLQLIEDGAITPLEQQSLQDSSTDNSPRSITGEEQAEPTFIIRQRNKIFFEQINYQDITAGWFKLEIDRYLLEQNFRAVFIDIQLTVAIITIMLFGVLIFVIYRFDKSIGLLAANCQHILIQNDIKPPTKKSQWLDAIKTLSQSHQQRLHEHVTLPNNADEWVNSRVINQNLICFLEFRIQPQENIQTAEVLTQAESFLNKSAQAFGVQTQGDILSGCLIPFANSPATESHGQLLEAISLVYLVKQLFAKLPMDIQVKSFIMRAPTLFLEDEQDIITGVSLLGPALDKIKQLSLLSQFGDIVSVSILQQEFQNIAECRTIENHGLEDKNCFLLTDINLSIQQQTARKLKYISQN